MKEKHERLNIIVGDSEKDLVMEAYNSRIGSGWDAVLQQVKQNIERFPLSSRIVGYYLEGGGGTKYHYQKTETHSTRKDEGRS